jgi:class 3 adenylate cyclase/tetratricopeptide (TPR) repeat protein
MAEGTKRRLAAIVSADVVGYSRLMGVDEAGTLRRLNAHRSELIDEFIEKHGGRIVKTTGDGLLLEFPSVVAAVECVVAVQEGMSLRNASIEDDEAIRFRIGVHLGDVIVEGDDIFGDGVNIAARLQEIGDAGGVTLSTLAYESVVGRVDAPFADLGRRELKNIARPVGIWGWRIGDREGGGDSAGRGRDPLAGQRTRLAVGVLTGAGVDPGGLGEALRQEIMSILDSLPWFSVVSDPDGDAGADYRLSGTLRRAGSKARLQVTLRDLKNDRQVMAQRYVGDPETSFDWQDETVAHLTSAVRSLILDLEIAHLSAMPHRDMNASDLYLIGTYIFERARGEQMPNALRAYKDALSKDPSLASAHSRIAMIGMIGLSAGWPIGEDMSAEDIVDWAEKGARLAPESGEAASILGLAQLALQQKPREAEQTITRALELDPNSSSALIWAGFFYVYRSRAEEALPLLRQALVASPLDHMALYAELAMAHAFLQLGRDEEAYAHAQRAIDLGPQHASGYRNLAAAAAHLGRRDDARAAVEEFQRMRPGHTVFMDRRIASAWLLPTPMTERIYDGLRKAGLPEK